jgi:hypothetical protein
VGFQGKGTDKITKIMKNKILMGCLGKPNRMNQKVKDIMLEHQYLKKSPPLRRIQVCSHAKQAKNSTTALLNLHSLQKLVIHQKIQIKLIKIRFWCSPTSENTAELIFSQLQMDMGLMANWFRSMLKQF